MPQQIRDELVKPVAETGGLNALSIALSVLSGAMPDYESGLERDEVTERVARKMLRDPDVSGPVSALLDSVLSDGWSLSPAYQPPIEKDVPDPEEVALGEEAEAARLVMERVLGRANGSFVESLRALAEAVVVGYRIAPIVAREGDGDDVGRLMLESLVPVAHGELNILWDTTTRTVVGFRRGSKAGGAVDGLGSELREDDLPAYKCVLFSHRPWNGDPRGTSVLRAAYDAWFLKTRVLPEFARYMGRFGSPSIVGKTAPDQEIVQETGAGGALLWEDQDQTIPKMVSARSQLRDQLIQWVNAMVIAVANGTEIDLKEASGSGEAFERGLEYFGRQIAEAILGTAQATKEAQHESRSSKAVAQDVVGLRVRTTRESLTWVVQTQLVQLFHEINFGADKHHLCPRFSLSDVEAQDEVAVAEMFSDALAKGFLKESQLQWAYRRLGWPQPDWDAEHAKDVAAKELEDFRKAELDRIMNP